MMNFNRNNNKLFLTLENVGVAKHFNLSGPEKGNYSFKRMLFYVKVNKEIMDTIPDQG